MSSSHLTLEQFRERFPEFEGTPAAVVQAQLDAASRRTPPRIWREETSDAHGYLAAHLLVHSAFGRDARIDGDPTQTTYGSIRDRMELELGAAVAPRVA